MAAALPVDRPLAILDSGAGTGYYLQHVLSHSPIAQASGTHSALAADASAVAVAMTVAATGSCGLVADVWRPSPVRDARADVILCVFAPRNPAEFTRILRPGGALVVVTPAAEHLAELRAAGLLIGMQHDKLTRLDDSLAGHLELERRDGLAYEITLSTAAAADLTAMGPSGHHASIGAWAGGPVTVSVDLSVYRRA